MISIIIPAYNEDVAITETITELKRVLENANIKESEIVVVDDGSSDQTGQRAMEAGARVLANPHNVGYGRSLKTGIMGARYDTICITDADLTYPAEAIPMLLKEYQKGFDMVVGERTGHHYRGSMFKGPLRRVLRLLVEFAASRRVPDANSGLRIFSKQGINDHLKHLCDTFSFTTSLTLAYMMTGKFVAYVPIPYYRRVGETKVRMLRDSVRTLQYIAQSIMYYNPMKIFLLFSMLCVFLSFAGFVLAFLTKLTAPYFLGIGGLLLALLMVGLGLMAELLRQILIK